MAVIDLQQPTAYEVFESGYYTATVLGVTIEDHDADLYHDKPYKQLRWQWEITLPDREDKPTYSSWTSLSLNEKAKLPGLLRALGVDAPTQLDTDALVGLSCRINIGEKVREDGSTKNHTLGYAPIKAAAKSGSPKAAQPTGAADDKLLTDAQIQRLLNKMEIYRKAVGQPYPEQLADPVTVADGTRISKAIDAKLADLENVPF